MPTARILGSALAIGLVFLSAGAVIAGDAAPRALDTSIPEGTLTPPPANRDGLAASSAEDLSSRIDQLEATRAASDKSAKSPISLSVSGWVTQEVTVTGK